MLRPLICTQVGHKWVTFREWSGSSVFNLTGFYEGNLYTDVTWIKRHSKVWMYNRALVTGLVAKVKGHYLILTESSKP